MGPTGTGKSTFINKACGLAVARGDDQASRTVDVTYSPPFELHGHKVILIDTPGFDDTVASDTLVLNKIALSLSITYKAGTKLSGIIFTHRISANRTSGKVRKNFKVFQQLVGEGALRNVVVVTNFWDKVDKATGKAQEERLRSDKGLYKSIINNGATMVRHNNTQESAKAILRKIIDNNPLPLQIQKELIGEEKLLELTGAAVALEGGRVAKTEVYIAEIREVKRRIDKAIAAKDEVTEEVMEELQEKLEGKMKELQDEKHRAAKISDKYTSNLIKMEASLKKYTKETADQKAKALEAQQKAKQAKALALQKQQGPRPDGGFWGGFLREARS